MFIETWILRASCKVSEALHDSILWVSCKINVKPCLVNLISKGTPLVVSISRQASRFQLAFSKPCLVNLISKDTRLVFSISRQASWYQQAFSKPYLVNLISKYSLYLGKPLDINERSQSLTWFIETWILRASCKVSEALHDSILWVSCKINMKLFVHDSMNRSKIECIAYIYILL